MKMISKALQKSYNKPEIAGQELTMAKTLINSMNTPFNPSEYKDEYQAKLKELLETKIAGKEIVAPKAKVQNNVVDLMEALKASIEQTKQKPAKTKKSKGA